MTMVPKTRLGLAVICLIGLFLFIALFYAVEDWRGYQAWNECRAELAAKGETVDWKTFIPPPVPDAQNFFKAPKMAEWFIKPKSGNLSNEFAAKLSIDHFRREYCASNLPVVAEITILPTVDEGNPRAPTPDVALQFSALGNIFTIETNSEINSDLAAKRLIPLIKFVDVPITTTIENLARQGGINYMLDPKIGYGEPDAEGKIRPEPQLTLCWTNISCEKALLAILDNYDLQSTTDPKTSINWITSKTTHHLPAYLSIPDGRILQELWDKKMGKHAAGLQGQIFLASDPAHINPIRILCHSESPVSTDDLADLFSQFFPDDMERNGPLPLQINPIATNVFRVSMEIDSAADYLRWSKGFDPDIDSIREALKRPFARMDGDYSDPIHIPIPNLVTVRALDQMLAQRAQCHLVEGDPEKAMAELALIKDSRRILESAPTGKPISMVAAMINIATANLYLEVVRDGLQKHLWNELQLSTLASQLNQMYLAAPLIAGLQHQQILTINLMETILFNAPRLRLVPNGWKLQNLVFAVKLNQQVIEAINEKDSLVKPFAINDIQYEIKRTAKYFTPYSYLIVNLTPDLSPAVRVFAFNQATLNEAKVACALDRYRLVHGDYPETIAGLVPQFLNSAPPDPIDGRSLNYQRKSDGNFLLYSVGWNEKDDQGTAGTFTDLESGDWVW